MVKSVNKMTSWDENVLNCWLRFTHMKNVLMCG